MFLYSGRGYWQELIESIVWAHNKIKLIVYVQGIALSISQGRAVGLTHYMLGGILVTWSYFISRIISLTWHARGRFRIGSYQTAAGIDDSHIGGYSSGDTLRSYTN